MVRNLAGPNRGFFFTTVTTEKVTSERGLARLRICAHVMLPPSFFLCRIPTWVNSFELPTDASWHHAGHVPRRDTFKPRRRQDTTWCAGNRPVLGFVSRQLSRSLCSLPTGSMDVPGAAKTSNEARILGFGQRNPPTCYVRGFDGYASNRTLENTDVIQHL